LLAKVLGEPFQEMLAVYSPLLLMEVTGVAPVTGAVIFTLAIEIVFRKLNEKLTEEVPEVLVAVTV
jgi:hypothetical protein